MSGIYKCNDQCLFAGLDDDDVLDDIAIDNGQFLVECPPLGVLDGEISIQRDFQEKVDILLGSTKKFEHFRLHHLDDNLKLSKCKYGFFLKKSQFYDLWFFFCIK